MRRTQPITFSVDDLGKVVILGVVRPSSMLFEKMKLDRLHDGLCRLIFMMRIVVNKMVKKC